MVNSQLIQILSDYLVLPYWHWSVFVAFIFVAQASLREVRFAPGPLQRRHRIRMMSVVSRPGRIDFWLS